MEAGSDELLKWILVAALALLILPPIAFALVRHLKHRARRRLVDSPRKIAVTGEKPADCRHERSRSRARVQPDGNYSSICKRCGIPMRRLGPGEWEAAE
jgi:hypothetical protein